MIFNQKPGVFSRAKLSNAAMKILWGTVSKTKLLHGFLTCMAETQTTSQRVKKICFGIGATTDWAIQLKSCGWRINLGWGICASVQPEQVSKYVTDEYQHIKMWRFNIWGKQSKQPRTTTLNLEMARKHRKGSCNRQSSGISSVTYTE